MKTPISIWLADKLEDPTDAHGYRLVANNAAAELRRLHEVNQHLLSALKAMEDRFGNQSSRQEDQPKTYACNHVAETCPSCEGLVTGWKAIQAARAAIEKATGESA